MTQLALFFTLATLVEGIVEYAGDTVPTAIKQYVAAAVAIAVCVAYHADLLALLGLATPYPYVGAVLTGLILGRGSNYLHDFTDRVAPLKLTTLRAAVATLQVPDQPLRTFAPPPAVTKLPDEE